jgi:hypothetical protein
MEACLWFCNFLLFKSLQFIKFKLKKWNRMVFGNLFYRWKKIQDRLGRIMFRIKEEGMIMDFLKEETSCSRELLNGIFERRFTN